MIIKMIIKIPWMVVWKPHNEMQTAELKTVKRKQKGVYKS